MRKALSKSPCRGGLASSLSAFVVIRLDLRGACTAPWQPPAQEAARAASRKREQPEQRVAADFREQESHEFTRGDDRSGACTSPRTPCPGTRRTARWTARTSGCRPSPPRAEHAPRLGQYHVAVADRRVGSLRKNRMPTRRRAGIRREVKTAPRSQSRSRESAAAPTRRRPAIASIASNPSATARPRAAGS